MRRRAGLARGQHHYLCRWAPGIRTRDSLSMVARPVHGCCLGQRSIGHNPACFRILPCRTGCAPGQRGCNERPRPCGPSFLVSFHTALGILYSYIKQTLGAIIFRRVGARACTIKIGALIVSFEGWKVEGEKMEK